MSVTWFEIPAVVFILSFIGIVVIRACGPSWTDSIDIFIKRGVADERESS